MAVPSRARLRQSRAVGIESRNLSGGAAWHLACFTAAARPLPRCSERGLQALGRRPSEACYSHGRPVHRPLVALGYQKYVRGKTLYTVPLVFNSQLPDRVTDRFLPEKTDTDRDGCPI